jgi:hypothetical protein
MNLEASRAAARWGVRWWRAVVVTVSGMVSVDAPAMAFQTGSGMKS